MFTKIGLGILLTGMAALQGGCVIVISDEDPDDGHFTVDHDYRVTAYDDRDRDPAAAGSMLEDVRARFEADSFLRDAPILIAARDGVVTLRGEVNDPATLERAARVAGDTPGVESVVMKVVVPAGPGQRGPDPARAH